MKKVVKKQKVAVVSKVLDKKQTQVVGEAIMRSMESSFVKAKLPFPVGFHEMAGDIIVDIVKDVQATLAKAK